MGNKIEDQSKSFANPPQSAPSLSIKAILIGQARVGKTTLMLQYTNHQFRQYYIPSIGIDFRQKTIQSNDRNIKIKFWDTANQERFRALVVANFKGSNIILLVYDCCNRQSFEAITKYLKQAESYHDNISECYMCLIANKCDLMEERVINSEQGMMYAEKLGIHYAECSAKNHESIRNVLQTGVDWLIKNKKIEK